MGDCQNNTRHRPEKLLDELANLLKKQIGLARSSNLRALEALSLQVGNIAAKIGAAGILEQPAFAARRKQLEQLNNRLSLIVAAERHRVAGQLAQVRKGKKLLSAYAGNLNTKT